ncbi:hypothetical protein QJS04_geneDACA020378 [Acorus gramineus]|uniref:Uncharacterized protein n=1 Tax=Acorus gramineus TaxID=55184 RepID=A0AAV9A347_ACOGR|nr:hypothetical protein QJS04_geneDACA021999 [Acorus gramineus]KAK1258589.1 hypothetical protein QJS04_geneDACA020378 [Acorus gramineus]
MKREGRQHGMVRSHIILPPSDPRPSNCRVINAVEGPPIAGQFVKVPSKPTNHSKFTGRCRKPMCNTCHDNPVGKSKDKAKGNTKFKSFDTSKINNFSGSAAAEALHCLDGFV